MDAVGKKEERRRKKKTGERQGKDREKGRILQRSDVKNRLFGQKIAFFLHKFDKKSKNICIIAEFFVTLWSRFYRGTLARMYTHVLRKTVSKSITNRDTGRLETTRITKKPKNK